MCELMLDMTRAKRTLELLFKAKKLPPTRRDDVTRRNLHKLVLKDIRD